MFDKTVAVIGGTGNLGAALAGRWTKAGIKVVIGSRTVDRAEAAATQISHGAAGAANPQAAAALTSVLIFLNKTYRVDGAGLQITGELVAPTD